MAKEEFLSAIREMRMGEWLRSYESPMLDGTQWHVEITYGNGHEPVRICGSNAYPDNFSALKDLFQQLLEKARAKMPRVKKFESLTKYIPKIQADDYGEWVSGKGTVPYVAYSDTVRSLQSDIYDFCRDHPEYEHPSYIKTLDDNGLLNSGPDIEFAALSAKTVIALLVWPLRAERFGGGALLGALKNGTIIRCLERLEELDHDLPSAREEGVHMRAVWRGESNPFDLINGKVYEILGVYWEDKWFDTIDESGDNYMYPAEDFWVIKGEPMKNAVPELTKEQIQFIYDECGISKDELFAMSEDELYDRVYNAVFDIEYAEIPEDDSKSESERSVMATGIITALRNAFAEERTADGKNARESCR